MKLTFKLTDSGIKLGTPVITVKTANNTRATVVDPGFDFMVSDDQYLTIGQHTFSLYNKQKKVNRLSLNLPCQSTFRSNGELITTNGTGNWYYNSTDNNRIGGGESPNFMEMNAQFVTKGNYHIYMGKTTGLDQTFIYRATSGLSGVPEQVKSSGKLANYLIRFTEDGPANIGSTRYIPGTTETISGFNDVTPDFVMLLNPFNSGSVKTILESNNGHTVTGPYYNTSMTHAMHGSNSISSNGSSLPIPSTTFSTQNTPEVYGSRSNSNSRTGTRSGLKHTVTTTESSIFFEGRDRDFAITPVILNENGDLNLVQMDSNLSRSQMSADRLISQVLAPQGVQPDPNNPLPSQSNLDSLYVKI